MDMLSKLKNFWFYYKKPLLIALAVMAVAGYLTMQSAGSVQPDYHVGIVRAVPLSDGDLAELETMLAAAGEDVNGDGEILVQLHPYYVDLADDSPNAGVNNAQTVAALDADLVGHVSGIFLLEDVDTFQRITDGLLEDIQVSFAKGLYLTLRKDADSSYFRLTGNLS